MTIGGWVIFAFASIMIGLFAFLWFDSAGDTGRIVCVAVAIILIVALLLGMLWYFKNTASGQRAMVDQRSDIGNGLTRTVTVYTANGDVLATYTGKIDIEGNDGGYVLFDYDGKRYIYYNCFVESIAEIG